MINTTITEALIENIVNYGEYSLYDKNYETFVSLFKVKFVLLEFVLFGLVKFVLIAFVILFD